MNLKSYKTKFYLLLGVLPLVLLLSWNLAFSQTLRTYRELGQIKRSILLYPDPRGTMEELRGELASVSERGLKDPLMVDEDLMESLSKNLGRFRVRLEEFPETHTCDIGYYQVQTFRLSFSGRFQDLLKLIHYSEYEIGSCGLVSVTFQRTVKRKEGEKLTADLFFQSIYKKNP
jgi:hypothetical protein